MRETKRLPERAPVRIAHRDGSLLSCAPTDIVMNRANGATEAHGLEGGICDPFVVKRLLEPICTITVTGKEPMVDRRNPLMQQLLLVV